MLATDKESLAGSLFVAGVKCKLHKNDSIARYFDMGHHLISSVPQDMQTNSTQVGIQSFYDSEEDSNLVGKAFNNNDETSIKMDPHDARLLLSPMELCNLPSKFDSINIIHVGETNDNSSIGTMEREMATDKEENELQFERFCLLPEFRKAVKNEDNDDDDQFKNKLHVEKIPPSDFSREDDSEFLQQVNRGIVLPSHKRLYEIMKKTSKHASQNAQFQVLLKLKQSHNPDFGFLNNEHVLFPLYDYMVNHWKAITSGNNTIYKSSDHEQGGHGILVDYASSDEEEKSDSKGTTEGFFAMYTSSDEEENEKDTYKQTNEIEPPRDKTNPSHVMGSNSKNETLSRSSTSNEKVNGLTDDINNQDTIQQKEEKRRQRLKRARLKKDHFVSKMMINKKHP